MLSKCHREKAKGAEARLILTPGQATEDFMPGGRGLEADLGERSGKDGSSKSIMWQFSRKGLLEFVSLGNMLYLEEERAKCYLILRLDLVRDGSF